MHAAQGWGGGGLKKQGWAGEGGKKEGWGGKRLAGEWRAAAPF